MNYLLKFHNVIRNKVRYKLLLLVLFPIVLIMPVALALAINWGKNFTYQQLFLKVNTDLAVSHDGFMRIQQGYLNQLKNLAESYQFYIALKSGNKASVLAQVEALKKRGGYSFLQVIDATKNTELLKQQVQQQVQQQRHSSFLISALQGKPKVGVEIYSSDDLQQISQALKKQVELPLIKTPRARLSKRTLEDRAMVIHALFPIKNETGEVVALLDGGVLLNDNFQFVDAIRDLAYAEGSLPEGSFGTVTVFLDDVRISTNVPLKKGERALGTRVSNEVRSKVLDQGEIWIDRAFVVNDWYISSYEPILDIDGNRVGMLYAGFLEKPFRDELWKALVVLVLMFLSLMLLSAWAAIRGAKKIFKPIERMSDVVHATQQGDSKQRVGFIQSTDELGTLSHEFDDMLDQLQQRSKEIQNWADSLEDKVEKRTQELKKKNQALQNSIQLLRQTRQQLVVAEKLAALGELTAGVAHEINNPTAVMLGNLDIIIDELGDKAAPIKNELDLIIQQIYRIKDIINRLLQYAQVDEYAGDITTVDINYLVKDSLKLINHMQNDYLYEVKTDLRSSISIKVNSQELQQVIVNLLVNAIHALPKISDMSETPKNKGKIIIKTTNWNNKGIELSITDNGNGIKQEHLKHIFDPFFSTKQQGEGTGLGLSISYSLVRRYGGYITVESELGKGTCFKVWMLSEPKIMEDDEAIAEQLKTIS